MFAGVRTLTGGYVDAAVVVAKGTDGPDSSPDSGSLLTDAANGPPPPDARDVDVVCVSAR